jgi:hypothetical protein
VPAPKGHPRWGGRRKGVPNRVNAATRERIEAESDPVGFLCRVVRGSVKVAGKAPTMDHRINAAKILASKILPDLKAVEMDLSTRERTASEMTDADLEAILNGSNNNEQSRGSRRTAGSTKST